MISPRWRTSLGLGKRPARQFEGWFCVDVERLFKIDNLVEEIHFLRSKMGIIKASTDAPDEVRWTFKERNNSKIIITQLNDYVSTTAGMTDSYTVFY